MTHWQPTQCHPGYFNHHWSLHNTMDMFYIKPRLYMVLQFYMGIFWRRSCGPSVARAEERAWGPHQTCRHPCLFGRKVHTWTSWTAERFQLCFLYVIYIIYNYTGKRHTFWGGWTSLAGQTILWGGSWITYGTCESSQWPLSYIPLWLLGELQVVKLNPTRL